MHARTRTHTHVRTRSLQVRVVEFNDSTPVSAQVAEVAAAGVLVSVHTSNLANAQFMQPGSAVVELIQRNWIWHNLDESFKAGGVAGWFGWYLGQGQWG